MLNSIQRLQPYFCLWVINHDPLKTQKVQSKAGELAKELLVVLYPHNDINQPTLNAYYRNSYHVIHNMTLALDEYAKKGNLEAKIEPSMSVGQGGMLQPCTVKETFQAALDPIMHGGIQQTIAAIKEAHKDSKSCHIYNPDHDKILQVCEKICSFKKEQNLHVKNG